MTRNEAIDLLDTLIGMVEDNHESDYDTALRMAIKALEQEPCEDAISRQAVLAYIYNDLGLGDEENGADIERQKELESSYRYVKSLPSVNPQPKTGHWIYDYTSADGHKTYHCSECGCYLQPKHSEPLNSFKWCSSCGVRMIEE